MKSQDLFLLLKLLSIEKLASQLNNDAEQAASELGFNMTRWQDWDVDINSNASLLFDEVSYSESWLSSQYSVRAIAESTGVSKTEVSAAINRCINVGLLKPDRYTSQFLVNKSAVIEFMLYGMRYVFPAKQGELTRGIATGIGAPIFLNKLMSAGDLLPVWPDPNGRTMGLSIKPLFKTVPYAVKRDPRLYALLAIADALRVGKPRESKFAADLLKNLVD